MGLLDCPSSKSENIQFPRRRSPPFYPCPFSAVCCAWRVTPSSIFGHNVGKRRWQFSPTQPNLSNTAWRNIRKKNKLWFKSQAQFWQIMASPLRLALTVGATLAAADVGAANRSKFLGRSAGRGGDGPWRGSMWSFGSAGECAVQLGAVRSDSIVILWLLLMDNGE